jgi:hypothetical protein
MSLYQANVKIHGSIIIMVLGGAGRRATIIAGVYAKWYDQITKKCFAG